MANSFLYTNNATATLAANLTNVATSCTLSTGSGALFPSPGANQQFSLTFTDAATGLLNEIVYCTARSGDVLTIVRAQESTTGLAWNAGDNADLLVTAGDMASALQTVLAPAALAPAIQAQAGNIAAATLSGSAYSATYNPPITAHVIGVPLRLTVGTNNPAGALTFNPGPSAKAMLRGVTAKFLADDLDTGGIYTATYNGTAYVVEELVSASLAGSGAIPIVSIPNDGAFHTVVDLQSFTSFASAVLAINAVNAGSSQSWSGIIFAVQFASGTGAGNTPPACVSTENSPGTMVFQVVGTLVQLSITGGAGAYNVGGKVMAIL